MDAMSDQDRLLWAINDLEHKIYKQLNGVRITIDAIEVRLAEGAKTMAIFELKINDLVRGMAETDVSIRSLENNDRDRASQERERDKQSQPKQYNPWITAAIGAFVTVLVTGAMILIYSLIKTTPGISP